MMNRILQLFKITCLTAFLAFLHPMGILAGGELIFSDLNLKDGFTCTTSLQKGNLSVSIQNGTGKYNKQMRSMVLPKGTTITISTPGGETISGLSLRSSGKSSDMKDFFSCEIGKFEHGIWKGTSNRVTFRCLKDCDISKIRASFKTDKPKAYVVWGLSDEFYHLSPNCDYFTNDLLPVLYMCYNERVELIEQYSPIYEYVGKTYLIDENAEAPDWYEKYGSPYSITIESSFINYHPKRTSRWFAGIETQIFGLENLNTSEVTDMSYMFAGFKSNLKYYLYGKGGDYTSFYDSLSKHADPKNNFVYEILKTLDFSNVKDMNHMFATSIIPFFEMPDIYIPSKVNTNGLFQGCGVKYIKITSNLNVNDNFFDGVGTENQPCAIYAPESFDFESTSTNSKLFWRGGYFIIPKAEGYAVLTENYSEQEFDGTSDNINLTFYFDDQKYIQEQDSYTFYTQPYENVLKHYMRKSTYDLNSGYEVPQWLDDVRKKMDQNFEILELTINFDKSFSSFKPKTTHRWFDFNVVFYSRQEKKIIYGIENLDMSETTIASIL